MKKKISIILLLIMVLNSTALNSFLIGRLDIVNISLVQTITKLVNLIMFVYMVILIGRTLKNN